MTSAAAGQHAPDESDTSPADGELAPDAVPICLNCAAPLDPLAHYCNACGVPAGDYAPSDPMRVIHMLSHAFLNAMTGNTTTLAFVGMVLIFGSAALLRIAEIVDGARFSIHIGTEIAVAFVAVLALEVVYAIILVRVTTNYIRGSGR